MSENRPPINASTGVSGVGHAVITMDEVAHDALAGDLEASAMEQDAEMGSQHGSKAPSQLSVTDISTGSSHFGGCQVPFEEYRLKVIQLCNDLGLGEPSAVEYIRGGSFNRITSLTFPFRQPQRYILRVPRNGRNMDKAEEVKDQVATAIYLGQHLKVPSVFAYDSTQNNVLRSAYVIDERLPGTPLELVYYTLPQDEKIKVATQVAELMIKMGDVVFPRLRRLAGSHTLPSVFHGSITLDDVLEISNLQYDHCGDDTKLPDLEATNLPGILRALLEARAKILEESEPWMVPQAKKLQKYLSQMDELGFFRQRDEKNVLWHWDFAGRNIMCVASTNTPKELAAKQPSAITDCSLDIELAIGTPEDSDAKDQTAFSIDGNPSAKRYKPQIMHTYTHRDGETYRCGANIGHEDLAKTTVEVMEEPALKSIELLVSWTWMGSSQFPESLHEPLRLGSGPTAANVPWLGPETLM